VVAVAILSACFMQEVSGDDPSKFLFAKKEAVTQKADVQAHLMEDKKDGASDEDEKAVKDGASDEAMRTADQAVKELEEADAKEQDFFAEADEQDYETDQDGMSDAIEKLMARAEELAEEAGKDGASDEAKRASAQAEQELEEASDKEQGFIAKAVATPASAGAAATATAANLPPRSAVAASIAATTASITASSTAQEKDQFGLTPQQYLEAGRDYMSQSLFEIRAEETAEEAEQDGASDETKKAADQAGKELEEAEAKEQGLEAQEDKELEEAEAKEQGLEAKVGEHDIMSEALQKLDARAHELRNEADKDGALDDAFRVETKKRAAEQAEKEFEEADSQEQDVVTMLFEQEPEEDETGMSQALQNLATKSEGLANDADLMGASDETKRAADQAAQEFIEADTKEQSSLAAQADKQGLVLSK